MFHLQKGVTVHDENISLGRDYSFELIEDFTPQLASHLSLSNVKTINTGIYEAVCGVTVSNGLYLIKGDFLNGRPKIALCRVYIISLSHVPTKTESKALFDKLYKEVC